jgi:hypothetical protein
MNFEHGEPGEPLPNCAEDDNCVEGLAPAPHQTRASGARQQPREMGCEPSGTRKATREHACPRTGTCDA